MYGFIKFLRIYRARTWSRVAADLFVVVWRTFRKAVQLSTRHLFRCVRRASSSVSPSFPLRSLCSL